MLRLAASVAYGDNEIRVPAARPPVLPRYLEQPTTTDPGEYPEAAVSEEKPLARVSQQRLRPRDHELAWKVVLPNRLARDVSEDPTLAWAVKEDIAITLALLADRAYLSGTGAEEPLGIRGAVPAFVPPGVGGNSPNLALARAMVSELRARPLTFFQRPGWVLHPLTLDRLVVETEATGRSLDSTRLLTLDGQDGGVLLGYPFIVTEAAEARIYLSSDWREAWVGVDRDLVNIDISIETAFQSDDTVVRAVMRHDFLVRRSNFFVHADQQ